MTVLGVKGVVVTGDLEHLCYTMFCGVVLWLSQNGDEQEKKKDLRQLGTGDNFMVRWWVRVEGGMGKRTRAEP